MNFVQPIRDPQMVEAIRQYFKVRNFRNYIFFSLGVYSGLRVSDLLNLKVGQVRGTHIDIVESKTKKRKRFIIHPSIRADLDFFIRDKQDHEYLFQSRQRKKHTGFAGRPIDRSTAYKMLREAADHFGLTDIGTHTMRKTWGYHLYMQDPRNLALLMRMFNHTSETVTLMYLGLTQDLMDSAIRRLKYA
ncbi:MAG: site-specific integrase [Thermobacillus sp.]|jgi:integrase|uniref:tyrosine-type recombinase/integrase n=1 Tax=Thermobacillus sp. TaxID=2108467 RepID=UPI000E38CE98|nr:tyrosine-type recombinase/integrase [Thermobacillus sp.]REK54724.1 MAG: site-specific integrase [Thermobacillus sp.]